MYFYSLKTGAKQHYKSQKTDQVKGPTSFSSPPQRPTVGAVYLNLNEEILQKEVKPQEKYAQCYY